MSPSATPHLDEWQDLHAQACKAEHNLLMATLVYLSGGTQAPSRDLAATSKKLRHRACQAFDAAVDEVFTLVERSTLRSKLPGGAGGLT